MSASRPRSPWLFLSASLALLLAWVVASHGFSAPVLEALAYLLPALGLLAVLHARRYPGERALLAAIGSPPRPQASGENAAPACATPRALFPRGGRLIACSLAVRPPPRLLASPV